MPNPGNSPHEDLSPTHEMLRRSAPPVPVARQSAAHESKANNSPRMPVPVDLGSPSPEPRCKTRALQRSSELTPRTAEGVTRFVLGAERLAANEAEQRTWRGLQRFVYFPQGADDAVSENTSVFDSPACPSPGEEVDRCEVAAERDTSRACSNSRNSNQEETFLFKSSGVRPDLASRLRSIATPGRAHARQDAHRLATGTFSAASKPRTASGAPPKMISTIPIAVTPIAEVAPVSPVRPSSFSQATDELRRWLSEVERHRWDVASAMELVSTMAAAGVREDSGCFDPVGSAVGVMGIREESECYGQHESCLRCRGRCNCQLFEAAASRIISSAC